MKLINFILLALFFNLLLSCSSAPNKGRHVNLKKIETPTVNIGDKLDNLLGNARESGSDVLTFVSSDLYLKASYASKNGDHATAALLYQKLVQTYPKDAYLRKVYGFELVGLGKLEESRDQLKLSLRLDSKNEKVRFVYANILTALGDVKSAQRQYRKILQQDVTDSDACIALAKTYHDLGKFKQATSTLNWCQKKNPKDASYTYYLGKFLLENEKQKAAFAYFKKAQKIEPSMFEASLAIGLLYEEWEKPGKAIKIYRHYTDNYAPVAFIVKRLINLMFAESMYREVIPYAEMLSSQDPSDLNLKVKLGILYSDVKRYDDAIVVFKDILEVIPSSDKVLYYLGSIHQEKEEPTQAISYFQKISDKSALFYDSNIQIAEILMSQALLYKPINESQFELKQDIFLDFTQDKMDDHEKLKLGMGLARANFYEKVSKIDEAIDELEPLRELEGYTENQDYFLAMLYDQNKEFDKAYSILFEIIKKNPQNAHAYNFLGYSYVERGIELDKAYEYIMKAIKILPDDGYFRDSLGWYYYKVGNYEKSLKELQRAYRLVKSDSAILKHLGLVYQKLQNYSKANKFFNNALKVTSKESHKLEVKKLLDELQNLRLPAAKK